MQIFQLKPDSLSQYLHSVQTKIEEESADHFNMLPTNKQIATLSVRLEMAGDVLGEAWQEN